MASSVETCPVPHAASARQRDLTKRFGPGQLLLAVVAASVAVIVGLGTLPADLAAPLGGAFFVLIMVIGAVRAARRAHSLAVQLASVREMLARESALRQQAQDALSANKTRLDLLDVHLPAMVAYVNRKLQYVYHNRAFREWLALAPDRIDGRHMRDVLGTVVFAEIEAAIEEAFAGQVIRYERTQKMANGAVFRLSVQLIPNFAESGAIDGFFALLTDITDRTHVQSGAAMQTGTRPLKTGVPERRTPALSVEQALYVDSFTEQTTGWQNGADRILLALEKDEFRLFGQPIAPLLPTVASPCNCEVLLRLLEEEENLMPPGAFLSVAEQYGLMPQVDRWVVRQALRWARTSRSAIPFLVPMVLWINVSQETASDPDFVDFVEAQLHAHCLPSNVLCFEIQESDLESTHGDAAQFIRKVRELGCRAAVSGFGRESVSFDLLKRVQVDFLKIDGSVVLDLSRNPLSVARITSINRVAHAIGIETVAELVESDEVLDRLRDLDTSYGQGFGIAKPLPLENLGMYPATAAEVVRDGVPG